MLRQQIQDPCRHGLIPHKKRRIPPEPSPIAHDRAGPGELVIRDAGLGCEVPHPGDLARWRGLGTERRHEEAEGEGDEKPDQGSAS